MATIALIPAAGAGTRMGAGTNKQYLLLGGMPILARTVAVFEQAPFVDAIYIVSPREEIAFCEREVVAAYRFAKVRAVLPGGAQRQHSVMNGLRAMEAADDDVVLIHDGVRPLVTAHVLQRAAEVARVADGALVAVPAKDTIKVVEDGTVRTTLQRETIWLAQTPQAFRYEVIRAAHEIAEAESFLGTDDASLVERLEKEIRIVLGDYRNIKITTPEDLVLAEALLKEQQ